MAQFDVYENGNPETRSLYPPPVGCSGRYTW